MRNIFKIVFALILILAIFGCRKSDYQTKISYAIVDEGNGVGTTTWKNNSDYLISGLVFVNEGQTLTIEAGTVIKFEEGQGDNASALIVARGGKIVAEGTPENPIIFTSEKDDLEGSVELHEKGLWGGLILLGNAPINAPGNEASIEGLPLSDPRVIFGGNNPEDNSGILRYISIRHGGTSLGEGNEINGLTLGGVGSETKIDHIEVISQADDAVEIFGGTVNLRYIISAFCNDDCFDVDMGYQGMGQFWLAIQENEYGNFCLEIDNNPSRPLATPYSHPNISNVTFIGRNNTEFGEICSFMSNSQASIVNSIFSEQHKGFSLEYKTSFSCFQQFANNEIIVENSSFQSIAENSATSIFTLFGDTPSGNEAELWSNYFETSGNKVENVNVGLVDGKYFILPTNISSETTQTSNSWFYSAPYRGAFNDINWTEDWSLVDKENLIEL